MAGEKAHLGRFPYRHPQRFADGPSDAARRAVGTPRVRYAFRTRRCPGLTEQGRDMANQLPRQA